MQCYAMGFGKILEILTLAHHARARENRVPPVGQRFGNLVGFHSFAQ